MDIISRLRNSSEGRKAGMPVEGYRSILLQTRLRSLLGVLAANRRRAARDIKTGVDHAP